MNLHKILSPLLLLLCVKDVFSIQCLDNQGKAVDWFSIYKIPEVQSPKGIRFQSGLAFVYMDARNPQWGVSGASINDSNNAMFHTLQQIYQSKGNSILYMMYNDEVPKQENSKSGHTKGVVSFNSSSGFWMVHSSPKFPPERSLSYKWTATNFGQTVLCISLPYHQLEAVATQLMYNEPHVYDYTIPASFSKDFPMLEKVVKRPSPPGPPWYSVKNLTSLAGTTFLSFAKSHKFGADLYDDLVAPTLKSDLLVETWLRTSGGNMTSNCTAKFKVYKVTHINLPGPVSFKESDDHAKWATSYVQNTEYQKSPPWTCIGDINRMKSQFKRGGGTVCLQDYNMAKNFRDSVGNSFVGCK